MILNTMYAFQGRAYEIGGNTAIILWDIPIPQGAVKGLAQVSLASYREADDQAGAMCAIVGVWHHGVFNGTGYPEAGEPDAKLITYDDGLTGVRVHLKVINCVATYLLQVFVFE